LQKRAYQWAIKNKVALAYISDTELRQQRNKIKEWLKSIYLRRHFSKINYFFTVGNANEEFYAKHGVTSNKMVRMHFPIDLQQYERAYSQKSELNHQIRNQYAIEEDAIILLVVGKLVSWKSQDHIIDAMKVLEEQGYTTHLFMLGSGEMQEAWVKKSNELKKSKVYFPGFVSIELLPLYYAASDIYLCPAAIEPHSIAISEAVYMGCPVVLSNRSGSYGPEDDVKEGENGRVFPFGDIQFLAAVLKKMIVDKEERKIFSYNSHQRAVGFQQTAHYGIMEKLRDKLSKIREAR
jgi:glycosyltransferase involved in cell wall biosynthesis